MEEINISGTNSVEDSNNSNQSEPVDKDESCATEEIPLEHHDSSAHHSLELLQDNSEHPFINDSSDNKHEPSSNNDDSVTEYTTDQPFSVSVDNDSEQHLSVGDKDVDHVKTTQDPTPVSTAISSYEQFSTEVDIEKFKIFESLQQWEHKRNHCNEQLHTLCDPVIDQIIQAVYISKETNVQVLRFLKDRIKLCNENAHRLYSTTSNSKTSTRLADSTDSALTSESIETEVTGEPVKDNISGVTDFASLGVSKIKMWPTLLTQCNQTEAKNYEELAGFIDTEIIHNILLNTTTDFDKASTINIFKLKECRTRIRNQHKETLKHWNDVVKQFKSSTKNGASKENKLAAETSPGLKKGDAWLHERRYLTSATILHKLYQTYYHLFSQVVEDQQNLQEWKTAKLNKALLIFVEKMKETLGVIAGVLGQVHYEIDPVDYDKAKNEFLGRTSERRQNELVSDNSFVISAPGPQQPEAESNDFGSSESISKKAPDNKDLGKSVFFQKLHQYVLSTAAPCTQFVIKQGNVRRHAFSSGIFNKWSEGLLVLTWDRYLHMFRSHDDLVPLWSVYVPSSDIRILEEKSIKTIEIRDRKNLLTILGRNSFYFRPHTELDTNSWSACLTLANQATDLEYHREAEALVKNANEKELHDHSLWMQQYDSDAKATSAN